MRNHLAAASVLVLLTGCGPPSVEDYMEDPELLATAIDECTLEVAQEKSQSERCRNAEKAAETMGRNLLKSAIPAPLRDLFMPDNEPGRNGR